MRRAITPRRLWLGVAIELSPYAAIEIGLRLRYSRHLEAGEIIQNVGLVLFLLWFVSGLGWTITNKPAVGFAVFPWRIAITMTIVVVATRWFDCIGYCSGDGRSQWIEAMLGLVLFGLPALSAFLLWRWGRAVADDDDRDGAEADDDSLVDPANASNPSA